MCDHVVMVQSRAKVFLGGPPLVKMATGEDSDDESLGGAEMHARTSGLATTSPSTSSTRCGLGRQVVRGLNWRKAGPGPSARPTRRCTTRGPARHRVADLRVPFDPRDVLARVVDARASTSSSRCTAPRSSRGGPSIHGYPVGVLANARGVLFSEESEKAAQFIQLANSADTPLVFLQNTTGYMVGKQYEQNGIIKDGAKMINAVSNSTVPHLTIVMGASYGAGHYGMCGRAYNPRFLFSWPGAKSAVMGPAQLAGVLSIVSRQSAEAKGLPYDEEADQQMRELVEAQIESESLALANTRPGLRRWDPRPTGHPRRAGPVPVGGAHGAGAGRPRLRRVAALMTRLRRLGAVRRDEGADVPRTAGAER
jgi:acetyl-CoA carboxylase carboxyltransferase component